MQRRRRSCGGGGGGGNKDELQPLAHKRSLARLLAHAGKLIANSASAAVVVSAAAPFDQH